MPRILYNLFDDRLKYEREKMEIKLKQVHIDEADKNIEGEVNPVEKCL